MPREAHIPLFLWIATAVVIHLFSGGGATEISSWLGERADLRSFAAGVRGYVRANNASIEIAFVDDPAEPEPEVVDPDAAKEETDPALEPTADAEEQEPPEAEAEPEKQEPVTDPERKKEAEELEAKEAEALAVQELKLDKRIAVRQHVEDKNQQDNPDAEFLGDHANRVREQTQARITSTDQNDPKPSPGSNSSGVADQPGDSHKTEIAQHEDRAGEEDRASSDDPAPKRENDAAEPPNAGAPEVAPPEHAATDRPGPKQGAEKPDPATAAQAAKESPSEPPSRAQVGAPELVASENGASTVPTARPESAERPGKPPSRKRKLPPRRARGFDQFLGLGAMGTTSNGINLNLTPGLARDAVGQDQLSRELLADGARRRSQHLGSWKSNGLERWRSAIENYVSSVKPGNQTALNAARSPFATYLNLIHSRLHPIFADRFLASLDSLPGNNALNRADMSTNLEVVLDQEEGRIVKMGVTKTSGVTAFDIGALDSMQRASPFGAPPSAIVSPDGSVYLHWEFHRDPGLACSTYFARPFILKVQPKPAPAPTPLPDELPPDEAQPERHGALPAGNSQRLSRAP